MKTFKFSLMLRTRENTDVFITLDYNIYIWYSLRKSKYPLYIHQRISILTEAITEVNIGIQWWTSTPYPIPQ